MLLRFRKAGLIGTRTDAESKSDESDAEEKVVLHFPEELPEFFSGVKTSLVKVSFFI